MGKTILKSIAINPESTFSTAASSAYSAYVRVPAEAIEWTPREEYIKREVQTLSLGHKVSGLVGAKGGEVKFRVGIPGLSTTAASTVAAVPHPWLDELLEACAYASTNDTGTVVSGSGSSTTVVDVSDATGISVGSMVMIGGEARYVTAKDTAATPDNITVTPALTGAPANATVVYASSWCVTSDADPGTITIIAKGDGYLYRFLGCKGDVKVVETDGQKRPMFEFTFQVDTFDTTEPSGTFPSLPTVDDVRTLTSSPFYWGSTKTASMGWTFDSARTLAPRISTEGTQGRSGFDVTDEAPVASFKPYRASAFATDYEAETERSALFQGGATAGRAFAIYAHKAQISEFPAEADISGVVGHDVKLEIHEPQSSTLNHYVIAFF